MKTTCILLLALGLVACGESTQPAATVASSAPMSDVSNDPKYQNPLLNVTPEQFAAVLGECGKVLYDAPAASDAACRKTVLEQAAKQGITLSEANLDEPLVHDRYQYSVHQAGASQK